MPSSTHLIGSTFLRFDATDNSVAFGETYVVAWSLVEDVGGSRKSGMQSGRYKDRLEKRPTVEAPDGEWRIHERVLLYDWERVDASDQLLHLPPAMHSLETRGYARHQLFAIWLIRHVPSLHAAPGDSASDHVRNDV